MYNEIRTHEVNRSLSTVKIHLLLYLFLVQTNIKHCIITSAKDISSSKQKSSNVSFTHQRLKKIFSLSTKDFPTINTFSDEKYKDDDVLKTLVYTDTDEEETCKKIVESLTKEELEEAANTSFRYYNSKKYDKWNDAISINSYGIHTALMMIKRHLYSEHGDYKKALQRIKDALNFRKVLKINNLRSVFENSSDDSNDGSNQSQMKSQIIAELSNQPMVVRGYDKLNRALLLILGRSYRSTNKESFINAHLYMIERALACTEHATNGSQDKIAVIVNCAEFECVPPTKLLKEFFHTMETHYPNQLAYLALIDAPVLIRSIWFIIKPFIHPEVVELIKFVSGNKQKMNIISPLIDKEQAMPFMRPDGKLGSEIDILHFLHNVPVQYDYGK